MKNIGRIYKRDMQRLCTNVIALIVVIGISIIPALYAWFNIAANWDPYKNTDGIAVAVVNHDKGSKLHVLTLNCGDEIVANLKQNTQMGFSFTDYTDAKTGVESGKYYAAVIIPEDFSANMTSIFASDLKRPQIEYMVNEKKNAIAPKITDRGISAIQTEVDSSFIGMITETAAKILNTATENAGETQKQIADKIISSLQQAGSDIESFQLSIEAFCSTIDSIDALLQANKDLLPNVSTALEGTDDLNASAQNAAEATREAMMQLTSSIGSILSSGKSMYDSANADITDAFGTIATNSAAAAEKLQRVTHINRSIIDLNNRLIAIVQTLSDKLQIDNSRMIECLSGLNDKQNAIIEKLDSAAATLKSTGALPAQTQNDIHTLLLQSYTALSQAESTYLPDAKKSMDTAASKLCDTMQDVSGLLLAIHADIPKMTTALDSTKSSLASIKTTLKKTDSLMDNARSKLNATADKIKQLEEDNRLAQIVGLLSGDPKALGKFMSSPVEIQTTSVYPIENYGSAMTPFYSTLAFWVGGIVLVAILKVRVDEDNCIKNLSPAAAYLGRYLLFLSIGLVQSTIICLGDLYFLQIQCEHPFLFLLAGWISSFVYTLIIYTFTVSFGDIGKALAVICLVIQIAGAGGTFPVEVVPPFFQGISPFLPFTHGINAMRETVAGIYGMEYWIDLLKLLAFVPFAFILGLVLRKPLIRLNEFFDKRIEDTHLM